MKILITGSEGSLMQWVIPHLIKDGHTIVGVDNFSRYGITEIKRDYKFYQYDLTDKKKLNDFFNNKRAPWAVWDKSK